MQLVLVGLGHGGQCVEVAEQLDSVVGLNVVQSVAEHLQQRVQNSPRVALEHTRQQLTCNTFKLNGLVSSKLVVSDGVLMRVETNGRNYREQCWGATPNTTQSEVFLAVVYSWKLFNESDLRQNEETFSREMEHKRFNRRATVSHCAHNAICSNSKQASLPPRRCCFAQPNGLFFPGWGLG